MAETKSKTHKTIFGTTEKSNFILNMTNDQFNKFASVAFSIGFILIFILSGITEILSHANISEKTYDWRIIPSIALAVTGLIGISIFIVALIKQTLEKKQIAAAIISLVLLICMYISYLNAATGLADYSAFLGNRYGRYEGFMVYLSYVFIFLGSMSINKSETFRTIFRIFTVIMLIQCIWSALQFSPAFPSTYYSIPYLIKNPMLPSGSAGSPAFLATLLSIGLIVSVSGALYDKGKFSLVSTIAILPVSFFLVKTQTIIGYFSAVIIAILVIISFTANRKNSKLSSTPIIMMFTGIAAAIAFIFVKGFAVYDGEVIWQDGCRRLGAFGQYTATNENSFNIHNPADVYLYMWNIAADYIRKFPLAGLGPDAFLLPQNNGSMNDTPLSVDRPYNEYLFYAATLGIPSAISFTAILIFSATNGIKSYIKSKNWINYAAAVTAVLYIFTAIITNSTATVTPFVWFMLGTCCCTFINDNKN